MALRTPWDAHTARAIIVDKQSTQGAVPILHALQAEFGYIDRAALASTRNRGG